MSPRPIAINEQDFRSLGYLAQPRIWSNRLTVAALLVAVVNFGVGWNLRNCLKTRFANEKQTAWLKKSNEEARIQHEQRMSELRQENERLAKFDCVTLRERIQNRWTILQVQYQLDPREQTRAALADFVVFLQEYGESGRVQVVTISVKSTHKHGPGPYRRFSPGAIAKTLPPISGNRERPGGR
jgi:hypothetical protein